MLQSDSLEPEAVVRTAEALAKLPSSGSSGSDPDVTAPVLPTGALRLHRALALRARRDVGRYSLPQLTRLGRASLASHVVHGSHVRDVLRCFLDSSASDPAPRAVRGADGGRRGAGSERAGGPGGLSLDGPRAVSRAVLVDLHTAAMLLAASKSKPSIQQAAQAEVDRLGCRLRLLVAEQVNLAALSLTAEAAASRGSDDLRLLADLFWALRRVAAPSSAASSLRTKEEPPVGSAEPDFSADHRMNEKWDADMCAILAKGLKSLPIHVRLLVARALAENGLSVNGMEGGKQSDFSSVGNSEWLLLTALSEDAW